MADSQDPHDEPLTSSRGFGLAVSVASAGVAGASVLFTMSKDKYRLFGPWAVVFPLALEGACLVWMRAVSDIVPEPYLDEVFHIPQVQKYCEGKFSEWDDKITTPPGLYLFTVLIPQTLKAVGLFDEYSCSPRNLRFTSAVGLMTLSYLCLLCRREIEARLHEVHSPARLKPYSFYALHTAFNIALFPLLFFFSGLYYTDVVSTTVVVAAFLNHLHRVGRDRSSFFNDILTIGLGILSLFMRQTNVFWVVVFMGGLEAVHAVKNLRPERVDQCRAGTLWEHVRFSAWRYSVGEVHDLPLKAFPEDALITAISMAIAIICNPIRVARQIWPYVAVLFAFVAFVVWNEGVVLGDKSNHVATIHLAQMLYIWPFFAFFSLPLLLPHAIPVVNVVGNLIEQILCRRVPGGQIAETQSDKDVRDKMGKPSSTRSSKQRSSSSKAASASSKKTSQADPSPQGRPSRPSPQLKVANFLLHSQILWPIYLLVTIVASFAVVKFNTIVHPFTLADNRHYMFYIFRYTIRRGALVRYFLVLPYTISRWMVWGAMAGCSGGIFLGPTDDCLSISNIKHRGSFDHPPFRYIDGADPWREMYQSVEDSEGARVVSERKMREDLAKRPLLFSTQEISTSTGLIFLLATSLSLITAPLVEPRYFIIPWVMYRLLAPAWTMHDHWVHGFIQRASKDSYISRVVQVFQRYDARLIFETLWFVAINVVTGYIFLFKPYIWRAEDGTVLDEGRLQRFMW